MTVVVLEAAAVVASSFSPFSLPAPHSAPNSADTVVVIPVHSRRLGAVGLLEPVDHRDVLAYRGAVGWLGAVGSQRAVGSVTYW